MMDLDAFQISNSKLLFLSTPLRHHSDTKTKPRAIFFDCSVSHQSCLPQVSFIPLRYHQEFHLSKHGQRQQLVCRAIKAHSSSSGELRLALVHLIGLGGHGWRLDPVPPSAHLKPPGASLDPQHHSPQ